MQWAWFLLPLFSWRTTTTRASRMRSCPARETTSWCWSGEAMLHDWWCKAPVRGRCCTAGEEGHAGSSSSRLRPPPPHAPATSRPAIVVPFPLFPQQILAPATAMALVRPRNVQLHGHGIPATACWAAHAVPEAISSLYRSLVIGIHHTTHRRRLWVWRRRGCWSCLVVQNRRCQKNEKIFFRLWFARDRWFC
jgi:hypothetical protein